MCSHFNSTAQCSRMHQSPDHDWLVMLGHWVYGVKGLHCLNFATCTPTTSQVHQGNSLVDRGRLSVHNHASHKTESLAPTRCFKQLRRLTRSVEAIYDPLQELLLLWLICILWKESTFDHKTCMQPTHLQIQLRGPRKEKGLEIWVHTSESRTSRSEKEALQDRPRKSVTRNLLQTKFLSLEVNRSTSCSFFALESHPCYTYRS